MHIQGKEFDVYIDRTRIQSAVASMGAKLQQDYEGLNPLFVCVLNGAFMFMGDLMKCFEGPAEIGFLKAASYAGLESTGVVKFHEAGSLELRGRHVVLVEDIVDTGTTLNALMAYCGRFEPASLKVCTLLFKPATYLHSQPIHYVCFEVENEFLLGYGLDYDGQGRNLPDLYILKKEHD